MLSAEERAKIGQVNAENKWGIASEEYELLVAAHANARNRDDKHEMEAVEYRLTDLNFHDEVKMLQEGRYYEASLASWEVYA
jgi:hypothetical protein